MAPKDDFVSLDLTQTRQFLHGMRNKHHFVAIRPKRGKDDRDSVLEALTVDVSNDADWAEACVWIEKWNMQERCNVYFEVNPVKSGFKGTKAKKEDIASHDFFHADLDPVPLGAGKHEEAKHRLRTAAQEINGLPNMLMGFVLSSGNGVQVMWRNPTPDMGRVKFEDLNKRLNLFLGSLDDISCKGTQNTNRLFRLAGTWNWPSLSKIEKGYSQDPVMSEVYHADSTWPPLAHETIEALTVPERQTSDAPTTSDDDLPDLDWPPEDPDETLKDLHETWMADARYVALIDGIAHPGDRSASLMGICAWYIRHGLDIHQSTSLVHYADGAPLGHIMDQPNKARAMARAYFRSDASDVMHQVLEDDDYAYDPSDVPAPWQTQMPDMPIKSSEQFASELKPPAYIVRRLSLQKGQLLTAYRSSRSFQDRCDNGDCVQVGSGSGHRRAGGQARKSSVLRGGEQRGQPAQAGADLSGSRG